MANYVSNTIRVQGSPEHIKEFEERIKDKPRLYWENEEYDGFSFHTISTPPESVTTEEYHSQSYWNKNEDGTVTKLRSSEYSAEQWNSSNWSTGCDALEVGIDKSFNNGDEIVHIYFQTKWSEPMQIFHKMISMFPDLHFSIYYEEETGWGGELAGYNGTLITHTTYDEPSSHKDYADRNNEDGCICNYGDSVENWYEDCPRDEQIIYEVVYTYTHKVLANDITAAQNAIESYNNGFDMPANTKMMKYDFTPIIVTTEANEQEVN